MDEKIFSGTAQVEIQGQRALRFIELTGDEAKFEIIGLSEPKIQVIDRRPAVRKSMAEILKTGKVEELIQYFNAPAYVTIYNSKNYKMTINLEKTRAKKPRHMLWVAIGIEDNIPCYSFLNLQIERYDDHKYALFSLYKRPLD